jgi:CP family cyanate transporter-like MFS transporter
MAVWRDRLAWQVTLFMGLQSAGAYIVFGWLIPILRERGIDSVQAGTLVGFSMAAQGIGCLLAPSLAVRRPDQKLVNLTFCVIVTLAIQAMLFAPLWTILMWAILLGLGQGALVSLALTAIVLRSPNPLIASQLSAQAQFVGYLLASIGPLLVGIIRDRTGDFTWCSILFALIGVGVSISGWLAGRPLFVNAGPVAEPHGVHYRKGPEIGGF